jgi:hypothetical protein
MSNDHSKPISAEAPLDPHLAQAVGQFLRPVTVPILVEREGDQLALLGTGTFFEYSGKIYLVTAKHVFNGEDLSKVAIPEGPKLRTVHILGDHEIYSPRDTRTAELDISVLRLDSKKIIDIVRSHWGCLTGEDTTAAQAEGQFVICGYPSALVVPEEKNDRIDFVSTLLIYYTNRIAVPAEAEPPVDPQVDLFFNHGPEGKTINSEPLVSPKFQGVSGASVWQIFPTAAGTIWTPRRALKVVGIQSGARHGAYLRAKSWDYVRATIRGAEK